MSATPTSPERAELRPLPDDRDLLLLWRETVAVTVEDIVYGPRACSAETERDLLIEAQGIVAEAGRRLLDVGTRLRGGEVRNG